MAAVLTYLPAAVETDYEDEANLATYTFSAVDLGTASTDRLIIVVAHSRDAGSDAVNGCTIQGITADLVVSTKTASGSSDTIGIFSATVPTLTTGDVVVTYDGTQVRCAITVYATTGTNPVAHATDSSEEAITGSVAVEAGGFVLAGANQASLAITWSAPTTQDIQASIAGGLTYTSAHDSYGSAQTVNCSATAGGVDIVAAFASFSDASAPDIDTGVEFDGTTDFLERTAAYDTAADTKEATVSFWVKRSSAVVAQIYDHQSAAGVGQFFISWSAADTVQIAAFEAGSSSSIAFSAVSQTGALPSDGNFHHVILSVDLVTSTVHLWIDDVDQLNGTGSPSNVLIDWTVTDAHVGSLVSTSSKYAGCLGEFVIANEYIDVSNTTIRRKFLSAAGSRVGLGADGSIPFLSAPLVYLSGGAPFTNFGAGGSFVESGSLIDCALSDLVSVVVLTVADASHAHAADNTILTLASVLVVAGSSHAHSAENTELVQANTLSIQEAAHAHTADSIALVQAAVLAVQESLHALTSEEVTVSLSTMLAVQGAAHAHTADNVAIVQQNVLAVLDAVHAHTADNIDLTQANTLIVSDAVHAMLVDNIALSLVVSVETPIGRVLCIQADDRVLVVAKDSRELLIQTIH